MFVGYTIYALYYGTPIVLFHYAFLKLSDFQIGGLRNPEPSLPTPMAASQLRSGLRSTSTDHALPRYKATHNQRTYLLTRRGTLYTYRRTSVPHPTPQS